MLQLMDVPSVDERLKCSGYKYQTPQKLNTAIGIFSANRRAIDEMRQSKVFRQCLRSALGEMMEKMM